jgi:hypothetical protein
MVKYESPIIELKHLNLRPYTRLTRPNHAMQPPAGRRTASLYFMKTRLLQATLALAMCG